MSREQERKISLDLIIAAYLVRYVDCDDRKTLLRQHAMSAELTTQKFRKEVNRVRKANKQK